MKILFVSDLHFKGKDYILDKMNRANNIGYDCIISLGDNHYEDFKYIKKSTDKKIFGILGNHDRFNDLKISDIEDVNGRCVEFGDITISGLQGSFRYKNSSFPSYTQLESVYEAQKIPRADIFITHTGTEEIYNIEDDSHSGLVGIDRYIQDNSVKLHFHGHMHEYNNVYLENGCNSICIYKFYLIEIKDKKIIDILRL